MYNYCILVVVPTTLLHVVVRFTIPYNIDEREGEGEEIRGEEGIGRVGGEEDAQEVD